MQINATKVIYCDDCQSITFGADSVRLCSKHASYDKLITAISDELEALRVWLSNKNNATPDVLEGMMISRSKLFAVLKEAK